MKSKICLLLLALLFIHYAFCQDSNNQGYACTVSIAGIQDHSVISQDSVWNNKSWNDELIVLKDCSYSCKVISYMLTVTLKGISKSICSNSAKIFDLQQLIKTVDRGTNIVFSKIKYSVPGARERTIMHSITITVK